MILLDTPGVVNEQRNRLETRMMGFVKTAMRDADAIVAIVDLQRSAREVLEMIQPPQGYDGPPILVVLNKADALPAAKIDEAVVCLSLLVVMRCPRQRSTKRWCASAS